MDKIRAFTLRLRSLFRNRRSTEDLSDELQFHIERQIEENIAHGMSPEEARRAAHIEFGSVTQAAEECAQASGISWLQDFLQDLRYGLRSLRKSPAFFIVAVLTLALGIGACTAIFSLVNAVLIRSLPYGNPSRLVYLFTPIPRLHLPVEVFAPSYGDVSDLRQQANSYSSITAFEQAALSLSAQDSVERIGAARVDADFFSTFSSPPELGRVIQSGDTQAGHDSVILISHAFWQSRFGGSYDVLTKSLLLDGRSYRVIGVMPPAFGYPDVGELAFGNAQIKTTDVWLPLVLTPQQKADREISNGYIVARLRSGTTRAQAQAEMSAIMKRLDPLHPPDWQGATALVMPFQDIAMGPVRPLMWLLLGAVFFVLLIACSNAANLLLARAASRTHELGVRATLGAGRGRMVRQMLAESLLLGLAGGILGTAFAYMFLRALLRLDPGNIPRLHEATLDLRVLLFTLGISITTSLIFGLLPALAASRINLVEFLKSGGNRGVVGHHHRLRNVLVVVEVGLAVVLLAGAGLLLRSYAKLAQVNPGFSQTTVTMSMHFDKRYHRPEDRQNLFTNVTEKLSTVPGIKAVGAINYLPLGNSDSVGTFTVDGYPNQKDQLIEGRTVTPGYFSAMGIPLIAGRFFDETSGKNKTPPVTIVNQSFARIYFSGRDPIGKHMSSGTVIGVVGDIKQSSMEQTPPPQIFTPFSWQDDHLDSAYIAIRSSLSASDTAVEARTTLRSIDPTLALADIHTMGDLVSEANAKRSFQTTLLTVFAAAALLLALVGIYGLLSYSVKQRSSEIGVRLALGAPRAHVLGMILQQSLELVFVGSILGMAGAFALTRLLASYLFEVRTLDPFTFLAVPLLLLLVTTAACLIPGWTATRISPIEALRYE